MFLCARKGETAFAFGSRVRERKDGICMHVYMQWTHALIAPGCVHATCHRSIESRETNMKVCRHAIDHARALYSNFLQSLRRAKRPLCTLRGSLECRAWRMPSVLVDCLDGEIGGEGEVFVLIVCVGVVCGEESCARSTRGRRCG